MVGPNLEYGYNAEKTIIFVLTKNEDHATIHLTIKLNVKGDILWGYKIH